MGKGAFVSITNSRNETLTLFVSNQHCMYDDGAEGSNVSYFNNLSVPAHATLPSAAGQYVEVKASSTGGDTCDTVVGNEKPGFWIGPRMSFRSLRSADGGRGRALLHSAHHPCALRRCRGRSSIFSFAAGSAGWGRGATIAWPH